MSANSSRLIPRNGQLFGNRDDPNLAELLNVTHCPVKRFGLGKPTAYLADVDAIVEHIGKNAQGGDVVCVFSNGGFGGIHAKLIERLKFRK